MDKTIKCPFCGFEFKKDLEAIYREGQVIIVRGKEKHTPAARQGKRYVDLRCPECKREFETEV